MTPIKEEMERLFEEKEVKKQVWLYQYYDLLQALKRELCLLWVLGRGDLWQYPTAGTCMGMPLPCTQITAS